MNANNLFMLLKTIRDATVASTSNIAMIFQNTNRRKRLIRKRKWRSARKPNIDREFREGTERIFRDYFAPNPVYGDLFFRRRFRMQRTLFCRIMEGVIQYDPWFEQKKDRLTGKLGLSSLQKVMAAMRILAYGCASDVCDEYIRISEATARIALERFCDAIIEKYGPEYLRHPNEDDLKFLLEYNNRRGFPGMIGSIDCCAWRWEKCPSAHKGAYTGKKGTAIMLEAVADHRTWIWHAFAGMPGSMNDINIVHASNCFDDIVSGRVYKTEFYLNGNTYRNPYYLADGIYPEWSIFVKTIPEPISSDRKLFAQLQESLRKDVERCFGILQGRFSILKQPSRYWTVRKMVSIITTCCILHNMIVQDEQDTYHVLDFDSRNSAGNEVVSGENSATNPSSSFVVQRPEESNRPTSLAEKITHMKQLQNRAVHIQLQQDLIAHCWQRHGRMQ